MLLKHSEGIQKIFFIYKEEQQENRPINTKELTQPFALTLRQGVKQKIQKENSQSELEHIHRSHQLCGLLGKPLKSSKNYFGVRACL